MATFFVFRRERGASAVVGLVLAACLQHPCLAQVPGMPADETQRAWYTTFMARLGARVVPSLSGDAELEARVSGVWKAMVLRMTGGRKVHATPLDEYPLLSFVDDRFLVMKIRDARGKDTFVVRSDDGGEVPTLSSTLAAYLDGVVYPSLRAIAEEEREKIVQHPEYQPQLEQLAAQNPFVQGLPIRVPPMGPFRNRMVVFSGLGGRLSASDVASYERQKWLAGSGRVVGVARDSQWGVAVELADLVEGGPVVCRYRLVREVAAVKDSFVGEGRRGVLLREPRLGAVIEVSGCLEGCDQATGWTRIFPDPESQRQRRTPATLRRPTVAADWDAGAAEPGGLLAPVSPGSGPRFR
jgi:hypothetical protein